MYIKRTIQRAIFVKYFKIINSAYFMRSGGISAITPLNGNDNSEWMGKGVIACNQEIYLSCRSYLFTKAVFRQPGTRLCGFNMRLCP